MGKIKIVHNKLLRGWFVVTGPHHTPIGGGPFATRAEAKAWLDLRQFARDYGTNNHAIARLYGCKPEQAPAILATLNRRK